MICMYVLELAGFNKLDGLLMYADDGLVFREEANDEPSISNRK